jgi:hypothetical protein
LTGSSNRQAAPVWPQWQWVGLVAVLIAAAALRFSCLDSVPPGLTHDEAGHGHDAIAILRGARPIYQTVGYGREPLYDYLVAGAMALLGPTTWTLRFASAVFGLVTLAVTFAWARHAFDGTVALAAVALQAASFWSLATSRQALRSTLLPTLFTAAVWVYWRSVPEPRSVGLGHPRGASPLRNGLHWVAFGVLIGSTLYTYIPARIMWVVFPLFLVFLAIFRRPDSRRAWAPTLVGVGLGLALALPLLLYLRAHPGAEQRLAMLDAPLQALLAGDFSQVLHMAWDFAAGLFIPGRGDAFLAYNVPGRPVFDPVTGGLFLAGLGLCVARWRRPSYAFSILWLLAGVGPSLLTGSMASTTRSIAALPVLFLFPALAFVAGARWAVGRWGRPAARAAALLFVALVLVTGTLSARDYFAWADSADVRAAYKQTLVSTAKYLENAAEGGVVALSSPEPLAPHDPYVFHVALIREDLETRWFDARGAVVLPAVENARLILPASTPLDPAFDLTGLHLRETVTLRPDDLIPSFAVYDWDVVASRAGLRERVTSAPVNVADAIRLLGYDLRTPVVAPGSVVELITLWEVVDPAIVRPSDLSNAEGDLVLFTHALNTRGEIAGQEDRLDAPAWDWQAGDIVAQLHRFSLPADLAPGTVTLEVGAYRRADLVRLPVLVDGEVVGDSVLLEAVEVRDGE